MRGSEGTPPKWKSEQHKAAYMNSPLGLSMIDEDCQWCGRHKDLVENQQTHYLSDVKACSNCDDGDGEVVRPE